ncbi:MAG: hypothetical protein U5J95_03615 [Balneolaceae bacterium]|nr:hypothetical protein [Balneolaceae bacterium]
MEGTELIEYWEGISISRNKLTISPNEEWKSGVDYEIRIWNPMVSDFKTITPNIWFPNPLGRLNVMREDSASSDTLELSIYSENRGRVAIPPLRNL